MISTAAAASNQSEQPQQQTTTSSSAIKEIKQMVNNINQLLDKAIPAKIDKFDLINPTVHALVLADITEKTYNDYSYAYGIKPVNFSGSSYKMNNMSGTGMGMGMMTMGDRGDAISSTTVTNNTTKSHLAKA